MSNTQFHQSQSANPPGVNYASHRKFNTEHPLSEGIFSFMPSIDVLFNENLNINTFKLETKPTIHKINIDHQIFDTKPKEMKIIEKNAKVRERVIHICAKHTLKARNRLIPCSFANDVSPVSFLLETSEKTFRVILASNKDRFRKTKKSSNKNTNGIFTSGNWLLSSRSSVGNNKLSTAGSDGD